MVIQGFLVKFPDGSGLIPLRDLDQKIPSGESPVYHNQGDFQSVPRDIARSDLFPFSFPY